MDPIAPVGSGTTPLATDYPTRGTRPLDPAMLALLKQTPTQTGTARVIPSGRRGVRGTVVIDGNPTWSALNAALGDAFAGEEEPLQGPGAQQRGARSVGAMDPAGKNESLDDMEARVKGVKRRARIATLVKNIRLTKGKIGSLGKRIDLYRIKLRSLGASMMAARDNLRVARLNHASPGAIANFVAILQRLEHSFLRLERILGDVVKEYQLLEVSLGEFEGELSILTAE